MLPRLALPMFLCEIGITSTTALANAKYHLVVVDQTSSRPKINADKNVRTEHTRRMSDLPMTAGQQAPLIWRRCPLFRLEDRIPTRHLS
uniref:Putative secreted protein n=1 Tax=Ixodes ricinus TaxID=34613 RepID=A0A090X9E9_IXORI